MHLFTPKGPTVPPMHSPQAPKTITTRLPREPNRRAVGYVRTSTEKQDARDDGLDKQAARIKDECKRVGLDLLTIEADVASVTDPLSFIRRRGLKAAIDLAWKEGAILVVTDGTRLFRNLRDYDEFAKNFQGQVYSLRDGGIVSPKELRAIIASGEQAAKTIRQGTKDALADKKKQGAKLGSPKGLSSATKESARSRFLASQELVERIADVLEEDEAYSALPHGAFADLLNRRAILTNWKRPWTKDSVRRHRRMAEELLAERRALEAELDREDQVEEVPAEEEVDPDEFAMKQSPFFGMFS
ncbi:hypothetical protein GI374_08270 [Paracoccus sp. S-4012]|uniref:recombinase family protein n=1 Tax=Paracoccus sp. S-4012 TaxID=2665648 RepID=UPI0012B0484C|nr:recombinase family protein [Paracoccus sp. S-4012]MRX50436.1 hypothetical protein [Paracoccus sp. S-4012]